MKKYTLSKNGSEMGPYTLAEVVQMITKREVELFDYIFDETQNDWILLTEHADITQGLKANKPVAPKKSAPPPVPETEKTVVATPAAPIAPVLSIPKSSPHDVEWFVMKGQAQFGPFGTHELVRLMQEKSLFEFDFVWNASMKDWKRLAEIPQFSKESIQALAKTKEGKDAFFKRQHARNPYKGQVIVHDGNQFWIASGKEISDGGMGLFISNSMIVPGQVLTFHVKADKDRPAFNVKGEIVSKQFVQNARNRNHKVEYGVKFIREEQLNDMKRAG